jgi:hypothetical protein
MSRDLETAMENLTYGVGDVTNVSPPPQDHAATRDFVVNALAGIVSQLGARAMGM